VLVRSILLRGFDRECVEKIGQHMAEHRTKVLTGLTPASLEKTPDNRILVRCVCVCVCVCMCDV
jgi:thioredoxin reductase (NADPH)